jgi:hypothetical protein
MARGPYGHWGGEKRVFALWQSFEKKLATSPKLQEAFADSLEGTLQEGTGAPEGRADFPIFLQSVIRNTMRERFKTVAAKWQSYMGEVTAADFRETTVTQMNGLEGIGGVNEDGTYPRMRSDEEGGPSYAVGKHGGTYSVTMELVMNDQADVILNRIPREMGRAMAEYISRVVVAFFESNPTYSVDGLPFFSPARGNEVTGAAANPNETNLMAILDQIKLRRDKQGNPFTVDPTKILVRTPSQKATFDRIIRSQLTGVSDAPVAAGQAGLGFGDFFTGNRNPAYNVLGPDAVVDEPWFNAPNTWTVLGNIDDRPAMVMAWLRGRKDPFIGLKDPNVASVYGSGKDPYSFHFDSIDYKIRHFFGVAAWEPLAAFRAIPA